MALRLILVLDKLVETPLKFRLTTVSISMGNRRFKGDISTSISPDAFLAHLSSLQLLP
jgi:hypothetical protein